MSLLNIRFLLIISSFVLFFASCEKKSNTNFKVQGKLENLTVPNLYAVREISGDSVIIDTIEVNKRGEFTYKGIVTEPTLVNLYCGDDKAQITFFLEPGYDVNLKADVSDFGLAELKGGRVNDDLMSFKTENLNLLQTRCRILSKHKNLDPAELKNVNFQLARCVREYVEKHPNKIASVVLMNDYSINNISPELLGNDINSLKGEAENFYLTTSLKNYYDRVRISAVGSVAPDFTLPSSKGKEVSLKDFKGKEVLLIFDVKDAPLNIKYFDELKEIQQKLKDKVAFVAIVIDAEVKSTDPQTLEIANSLDFTVLLDGKKWGSKAVKKYNVTSAPYMILISADGLIQERDVNLKSLLTKYDTQKSKEEKSTDKTR